MKSPILNLLPILAAVLLIACGNINEEVENKIDEMKIMQESLDSTINNGVNKALSIDSVIKGETDRVKKLDSLISNTSSKIDSTRNKFDSLKQVIIK